MTLIRTPEQIEGGERKSTVIDVSAKDLLTQILTTLKKIEYHLYLGSDTELHDEDV